jgi:uncharacterized coiled-coil protein SlyX
MNTIRRDGNGGFIVGRTFFGVVLAIAGTLGFTTGDLGDFLDGPEKVRRIERIEVELDNLTERFEAHVKSNIDERKQASRAVERRFDELKERMDAQTQRLDAIYRILVGNGDGDDAG